MRNLRPVVAASLLLAAVLPSQTIDPAFAGVYGYTDLGSVPGVPGPNGGIVFKHNDPNKLLIGGSANGSSGAIYEVDVVRNTQGFITGFSGTATQVATAAGIDGGLCYGPGNVLFFTTYSNNTLGQIKPGSTVPDRIIPLGAVGVGSSTGTCNFVPPGFPGAGELKIASYNAWTYHGFTVSPDGNGTYDITPVAAPPVTITGGPEGILYVPPGSALIPDYQYVLISEYSGGAIGLYQLDANADPILSSRVPFMTGLSGAEGACTDPVTGDLMFSTFGGGNRVIRVSGFGVCGSHTEYGTGIAGQNGVPLLDGSGCAGRGQIASLDVTNGLPGTAGLFVIGFTQTNIPVFNGQLLVNITNQFFHTLDGNGEWSLTVFLPTAPIWNGLNLYSQSWYIDPAAASGVSATAGLHTLVR